jgi:creatinine amidohydrolase
MLLRELHPDQLSAAVAAGHPLLVPAGCVETHGPHMAIGHDTLIVEEICERVAGRVPAVIAPSFDYGPTGYALGGPPEGTIDPNNDAFGRYVKSILRNFMQMGFIRTYVIIMHQGMEGPLAMAFRKAASELAFDSVLDQGHPRGWWADARLKDSAAQWGRIQVAPMILPQASPPAAGDHAGYNETSFLLAVRPDLVDQSKLDDSAPWYCRQGEKNNSWTANPDHGQEMADVVVNAWVDRIEKERA